MWLVLASFVWVYYGKFFFGIDALYFLFYSFFWILGYNRKGKCKKWYSLLCMLALCIMCCAFCSYLQELPIYDLQSAKFPPSIKYGCASMITILTEKYFDGCKERYNIILMHIGRNAIWYYFAQGIGSFLNYYVVAFLVCE